MIGIIGAMEEEVAILKDKLVNLMKLQLHMLNFIQVNLIIKKLSLLKVV